ncbi:VTT domain-containing protein [Thioalkalivibrio sp.]|uniref:VTT domain-containing protein n=1 Tax=Thioalkalivibrio sp. TaxID=2093813 RepID=UPI0039760F47
MTLRLQPGSNCWRIEPATRFAVAIDGEDYFAQLRRSLIRAKRCIAISAWDIHSRIELIRPGPHEEPGRMADDGLPTALGELLVALLERTPPLNIFILLWDFAPIYALEREPLFFGDPPWGKGLFRSGPAHPRLHLISDDAHPVGGSQHQKIVAVDGQIAWCGGFDLSKWRWDTQAHSAEDERRRDPNGTLYPPFHDAQALVDGDAAAALMEIFLERWRRAGGGDIRGLSGFDALRQQRAGDGASSDPWPEGMEVLLHDTQVGIARTLPEYGDHAEVREVERLYLDTIAQSRDLLYIENQYLSSRVIGDALCDSLQKDSGPRILMILPEKTGHWLEQHTMDILRARILSRLRAADRHGRLRVCYPEVSGLQKGCLMVHAKLMISDDEVLRVASSNLSNRSMGLDSECDLCVIARNAEERGVFRSLRQRLLAMFLSVDPDTLARAEADAREQGNGMFEAIDALTGPGSGTRPPGTDRGDPGPLHLEKLEALADPEWNRQLPDERVVDPDRPLDTELITDVVVGKENLPLIRWRILIMAGLALLLLGLVAVWRFTPVGDWLEPAVLAEGVRGLNSTPWGIPLGLLGFVAASLAAVPVTLLILTSSLVFGTVTGASVALIGSVLSAVIGYGIGRFTGRGLVEHLANGRIQQVSRRLGRRGILTIITVRIVPVAPFVVLNLLAGTMHISVRDFVIGTAVGMLPGIIALAVFAEGLLALIGQADLRAVALVLVGILGLAGLAWLGRRLLAYRQ